MNQSNSQDMGEASATFEAIGNAMRRRGVIHATPEQASQWALDDFEEEKARGRSKPPSRGKTLSYLALVVCAAILIGMTLALAGCGGSDEGEETEPPKAIGEPLCLNLCGVCTVPCPPQTIPQPKSGG